MDQEKIGKFIKNIRKENNLTQAELAKKYGVTYQAVSKWENGKNMPDLALIKQMSEDFNIDINELLDGELKPVEEKQEENKVSKKTIIIGVFITIILVICIIFGIRYYSDFSVKTITSNCSKFNISGTIAYNKQKSTIHISQINYCGEKDNTKYKKIECVLYESHDNLEIKINSKVGKDLTLDEFLNNASFLIDNYDKRCVKYSKNCLFLQINATNEDGNIKSFKVPLVLKDVCK